MTLEKWLVTGPKVIDLELVRSLKVSLIRGQVDVIGHDEPGARVEVHSVSGKDLKITMDGDKLEIDHPQLRWDNFIDVFSSFRGTAQADISILVPRDVALKFGVVASSALISGLVSDARINTVSGDVVIDQLTGNIDLNAVNGELSIQRHSGNIRARTVSGDITASGEIRRFNAESVSGNMFVDLTGTPDEINTNSVSGDLTVRLAEGIGARYRVNTVSGTLQLDGTTVKGTFGRGYNSTTGSLDGTWVDIAANSVSGDLSVIRHPAARAADTAHTDTAPAESK
ncbi:DUF4097 family beta strand repeat-containing protein [Homoserinimonas sp. OAct 916]|uniref:DUF4097 family beta strand repeat-containing protein n=1 Tax=Homoserinimonas sp. OAct 916 TaxID=2211450 RepID=UPI000DBE5337|nr:DUF4097 family beta strand repeat-containing protein [Homoserinimonas sp. OAct 916]